MVRAISLVGWGHILAWLDDNVPGYDVRKGPPRTDNPKSESLARSPEYGVLVLWTALEDQGVTYEQATTLWQDASSAELSRVDRVLFGRRRTAKAVDGDDKTDIAETWCGEALASIARTIGIEAMGRCTLSQLEWLLANGKSDLNPADSPEKLKEFSDNVFAKWGDKLKALPPIAQPVTGSPAGGLTGTVNGDLKSMGLRIKESDG